MLQQRALVLDGAMGTMLQGEIPPGYCPELMNVERPELVARVHRQYLVSGCDILETNTFGGNRAKLDCCGLGARAAELNRAGVRIAREAARTRPGSLVAGSIGPTGLFLEPWGQLSLRDAEELFAEQAAMLADGGADLIIVETMMDLQEARAAVLGSLRTGLPVIAQMSFGQGGYSLCGTPPEVAGVVLSSLGASAVGSNCGLGSREMVDIARRFVAVSGVPVSALANAGIPEVVGGRSLYPENPEETAFYARQMVELGVSLIGGCCGTTPSHMEAVSRSVRGIKPGGAGANREPGRGVAMAGRTSALWVTEGCRARLGTLPSDDLILVDLTVGLGSGATGNTRLSPSDAEQKVFEAELETGKPIALRGEAELLERGLAAFAGRAAVSIGASDEEEELRRKLEVAGRYGAVLMVELHEGSLPDDPPHSRSDAAGTSGELEGFLERLKASGGAGGGSLAVVVARSGAVLLPEDVFGGHGRSV